MRYPYERFLKFLVSRKLDPNVTLRGYGLPPVGRMWLSDCRQAIRDSGPTAISNYIDSKKEWLTFKNGVLEWAEEEGIKELWESQPEFNGKTGAALDASHLIFMNPSSRAIVGMMLLSKADDTEICAMVKERLGIEIDDDTLAVYSDIFWDVEMLGREGWPDFIEKLDKEERHYLALGLGAPSNGECRDMAGLDASLDLDTMMKEMLSHAYFRLKEAYNHPNPDAANVEMWHSHWLKAWDRTNKRGQEADAANPISTGDYRALFSVQTTKSTHVSLTDLKGHLSAGATEKKEKA